MTVGDSKCAPQGPQDGPRGFAQGASRFGHCLAVLGCIVGRTGGPFWNLPINVVSGMFLWSLLLEPKMSPRWPLLETSRQGCHRNVPLEAPLGGRNPAKLAPSQSQSRPEPSPNLQLDLKGNKTHFNSNHIVATMSYNALNLALSIVARTHGPPRKRKSNGPCRHIAEHPPPEIERWRNLSLVYLEPGSPQGLEI